MATHIEIHHIDEVGSTQSEVRRLAQTGGSTPLLIVARRQTRGRGRLGHRWFTAPRALACSLLMEPAWSPGAWSPIPLVAGLSAGKAVSSSLGTDVALKWPNDLFTAAGKVGGVLVEAEERSVVVGLGLNLWWPDAPEGIAGLCASDPGWDAADEIAASWASRVERILSGPAGRWGRDEYRAACATLGTRISWEPDGEGEAVDIAPDGGLVVETSAGRVTLRSGDVRSVRPTTLPADSVAETREDPS